MMCCKEYVVGISAPTCSTEMVVTATTNASQDYPAIPGVPPWEFGSQIASGFPVPTFGSITLTFRSPTLKTWKISGGGPFNASGTLVRWYEVFSFPVAPTMTIGGVPVSFVDTIVNGAHFWVPSGGDPEDGVTFTTDACSDVVVFVSGTSAEGGLGYHAGLIEVEDLTP